MRYTAVHGVVAIAVEQCWVGAAGQTTLDEVGNSNLGAATVFHYTINYAYERKVCKMINL